MNKSFFRLFIAAAFLVLLAIAFTAGNMRTKLYRLVGATTAEIYFRSRAE
jgi:hypothetical protein